MAKYIHITRARFWGLYFFALALGAAVTLSAMVGCSPEESDDFGGSSESGSSSDESGDYEPGSTKFDVGFE